MMKAKDLIAEVMALPVEERAIVVDSLLKSMNPPEPEIDKQWSLLAKRRLEQIHSGESEVIPGDEVFQKIWSKFSK